MSPVKDIYGRFGDIIRRPSEGGQGSVWDYLTSDHVQDDKALN